MEFQLSYFKSKIEEWLATDDEVVCDVHVSGVIWVLVAPAGQRHYVPLAAGCDNDSNNRGQFKRYVKS